MNNVLFVFAHQDDEYFALPWIEQEKIAGNRVLCVYLTDGGSRTASSVRDSESRAALDSLGVLPNDVAFLGSGLNLPDGRLVKHLSTADEALEKWLERHKPIRRIYAPDYEGGHADHDAAHLIALAAAARRNITGDSWSFALYNACGHRRPVFRALRLLQREGARCIRYSIAKGLRFAMSCWRYQSQRRTWLGLFPESFFRRVIARRECVNRFDIDRVKQKPHAGSLLYEWMFHQSWNEFEREARPFLERIPT